MPRLMLVSLTEDEVRARTKTVTRRLGWRDLKPGTRLTLVRKAMGLKNGETVVRIADIEVVSVRREPLWDITEDDWPGSGTARTIQSAEVEGVLVERLVEQHDRGGVEREPASLGEGGQPRFERGGDAERQDWPLVVLWPDSV